MNTETTVPDVVRARYRTDGYYIFRNVLDADLIAEASDHVDWLQAKYPDRRPEDLSHELVAQDPFWVRLISDDRLLDVAEIFLGPNIALFASHYICKPPFSDRPVLWHQDGAGWPLEPMDVITLWLAVDESTTENGCLRIIPGSQGQQFHALRQRPDIDNVLGAESIADIDESSAVDLVLQPGDVEVHHPNILHASDGNTSPQRRCGLTIRYIPTSTRIVTDDEPFVSAFLLRGEPGVNRYQTFPRHVSGRDFAFRGCEEWPSSD
jgi:ectoine hydroxylase-related dioxygenase (phytanoyl-CoA dioxygenase family)